MSKKVAIIGSGNWGSAIAKIIGMNVAKNTTVFDQKAKMWVYEEMIDGQKLTEIINTKHENVKYLPGIKLPENIVAVPELDDVVSDADLLVFVLPHQFLPRLLNGIKDKIKKDAVAIHLIKGVFFIDGEMVPISSRIKDVLGIECCTLMGANVANEVAREEFCETTIGYETQEAGEVFFKLFNTKFFEVTIIQDVTGPEICGALKNIVAIGSGFCDGLGYGGNTKAAIMRIGLKEMRGFAMMYSKTVVESTFLESCGVGDLITTCIGGRNRKCGAYFAKTGKAWEVIEKELLNGQKIQGVPCAKEIYEILSTKNLLAKFPLFHTIHRICVGELEPKEIINYKSVNH
ncbi:glycerol-3-phosphate dehydrogenase [nad(+)]-related [Anaeramoeba flamelloides]|uniref:Glycerol-3-phosphate dehydrogenase [NAD(+)] n=1 Tax=Anaeramoeba flamelloides TaxID=1746091 RepID=A0AAV8A6E4_9EUKA|nr:glycerol-3-phosphate dehydrogenase [nad(+)]-related [Anaeramoeba flamelloides]